MAPALCVEVSPAMVAFGEMLMLPLATMQTVIEGELDANEALEREETDECPVCRGDWRRSCPLCSMPARGRTAASGLPTGVGDAADLVTDSERLLRDVTLETSPDDLGVVEYVVGCLDRHGLLDRSCAQLAAETASSEAEVERVVAVVRRVGPPGVGARSVQESLLLQLDALAPDDVRAPLARAVIADHLPALARGHFAAIATALGVGQDAVHDVLRLVRERLRPYPAFDGNARPSAVYVVPDVVVRERAATPGAFDVELVEPALNRLRVRETAPGSAAARAFCAQLRGRWETVQRIAEFVVDRQRLSLSDGGQSLVPLTRAETATELGLHESTVSRAVADKHALLPDGSLVPLSRFFGSAGGLDEALRRLVAEDPPSSDQALADRLRAVGYDVARRTVAKHRDRLGIAPAVLR